MAFLEELGPIASELSEAQIIEQVRVCVEARQTSTSGYSFDVDTFLLPRVSAL